MRALAAALALCAAVHARDIVVRVTILDQPAEDVAVWTVTRGEEIVFDPAARPEARTDATGQAVVDAAAGARVLAHRPGYAVAVVAVDAETLDVALVPEYELAGRIRDVRGRPVRDARVVVQTVVNHRARFPARTDDEGRYFVYGLWFDEYLFEVHAEGFAPQVAVHPEVVLQRLASLRGRLLDRDGKPLAGVTVRLDGDGVETDATGAFVFEALAPRGTTLRLEEPFRGLLEIPPLRDGEARDVGEWRVPRPVTVTARAVDPEGVPLAGAVAECATAAVLRETDEGGRVALAVQPGVDAVFWLRADGRVDAVVEIPPRGGGATVDLGDLVLRPLPVIEVRVRGPAGALVAEGFVGETALEGGIARVVGARAYEVQVPGFASRFVQVTEPGPVEIALPEPFWLAGRVLTADGAPAAGARVEDAVADEEGRFRLGPLRRDGDSLVTASWRGVERTVRVVPSEGELVVRLPRTAPELLRGRVERGGAPVRRYRIEDTHVADEEGRFEVLVDRAAQTYVRVYVDGRSHVAALPEPGLELVVALPDAVTRVVAAPGADVHVHDLTAGADAGGVARFRLSPGRYVARADGFAEQVFVVDDGAPPLVTLERAEVARLVVVPPPGGGEPIRRELRPGVHEEIVEIFEPRVYVERVRLEPGEQRIELTVGDAGALTVRAAGGFVLLRRTTSWHTVRYEATLRRGVHTFAHLPPGRYEVTVKGERREVVVPPGRPVAVTLDAPRSFLAGLAADPLGAPVQGARVILAPAGDERLAWYATSDLGGRFRFEDLPPGEYRCRVEHPELLPAEATVRATEEGASFSITVYPEALRGRLLGVAGAPLGRVRLRVDGAWTETDPLGFYGLPRPGAPVDLDLDGHASVRDAPGGELRLAAAAALFVATDAPGAVPELRIDGAPFRRLDGGPVFRPVAGGWLASDLPPGRAEVGGVAADLEAGAETRLELPG